VTAWRLRRYASLDSTSNLCLTLAEAGEPAHLAVLADRQTAPRGSRGRSWTTLPGNLALSVLLRPPCPPSCAGQWALLAAVALAEGLEAAGAPALRVKWPNDVLLDGRKLAGILLDSAVQGDRLAYLVIGFGANLAEAPDLPGVTKLPQPLPAATAADAVLHRIDHWAAVALDRGFAPIRRAWLDRGPASGAGLRLRLPEGQVLGTFSGLSETGALLLQSEGRVRAFATGDVLLGA